MLSCYVIVGSLVKNQLSVDLGIVLPLLEWRSPHLSVEIWVTKLLLKGKLKTF